MPDFINFIHDPVAYYQSLARKRMSASVLFEHNNNILIVKPSYKDEWSIPGGAIDENESPFEAAIRETKEEIGLRVKITRPLCFDYLSGNKIKSEAVHFIFLGEFDPAQSICIDQQEIIDYKWATPETACALMNNALGPRVKIAVQAIKNNTCYCCDNGKIQA